MVLYKENDGFGEGVKKDLLTGAIHMTAQEIWASFCAKLETDTLCDVDFTDEMRPFLRPFLAGEEARSRRAKFLSAPARYLDTRTKAIVMLSCPDDEYRFDFIRTDMGCKLAFVECITLPVGDVTALPYSDFKPLPAKENEIRREKEISRLVWLYCKIKELAGQKEAVNAFLDGEGESVCARSWVPFYSDRLACIAYAAWMENRINGEAVTIIEFAEERSVLRLKGHLWRRMYHMAAHLKTQIGYDEYMELFETICTDRARAGGWSVSFSYENDDTTMTFARMP